MAENSKIEWTNNTCNFWWGCVKVSPGCEHCYAETLSTRYGKDIWGPAKTTDRQRTKGPWREIVRWNKRAGKTGKPELVFVQSMSDFFEDHPQIAPWREEAMDILEACTDLRIQLLTKRPENVPTMAARWMKGWPVHIWIGTSIEDQKTADDRITHLLNIPAAVRFLSIEPLLGPVDLMPYLVADMRTSGGGVARLNQLHWVIVGGESGPKARPLHPDWVRSIRDQCVAAGVPFFFKQWGEWWPHDQGMWVSDAEKHLTGLEEDSDFYKLGKKAAGRLLDGREWNEYPDH